LTCCRDKKSGLSRYVKFAVDQGRRVDLNRRMLKTASEKHPYKKTVQKPYSACWDVIMLWQSVFHH